MKLKRIEIYGFKSFADKYEIPFEGGITAIVGPNGCGKSNVADSVRWVLGEQSAKLLRGSSMQDVIFNGTEKRKSMSYCEVALVFDNRQKLFPALDYDEVVISRKLYRSGESEYAVNRTPCRLKDITEYLRDAGMGREGYSIIGQGRVDELLSAKPEDRRAIFEEAAGISKFKARKLEAERKLARTRDNLEKVSLVLDEKGKMLEPLRKQAETAKKWLELREQLKYHEINTYIHQYETASSAKKKISDKLDGVNEALSLKTQQYEQKIGDYNQSMYNMNSVDKNIEDLRNELLELTVGLEKQAGNMKVLQERISAFEAQSSRLKTDNEQLSERKNRMESEISDNSEKKQTLLKLAEEKLTEEEKIKARYLETVEKLTEKENEQQFNQQSLLEAMDKLAEIKSNLSRLEAEKVALTEDISSFNSNLVMMREENTVESENFKSLSEQLASNEKAYSEFKEKLKALIAENNEILSEVSALTDKTEALSEKYISAKSRQKILNEMRTAFEGYTFSVKNLLRDAKTDSAVSDRIQGVVAQVISMDRKFETAIETALGGAMQNIITSDEEDAKWLIEYLKRKKYGRVTFLPLNAIKPRFIDSTYARALGTNGCYGAADKLVSYHPKFDRVIKGLLGGTVIVEDMDTAVSLARLTRYAFKIVTLEGDVINPQGSITGGSKKNDIANIFSHERELNELNEKIGKIEEALSASEAEKKAKISQHDQIEAEINEVRTNIHSLEVESAAKTENKNKSEQILGELESEIRTTEKNLSEATAKLAKIDDDLGSVAKLENLISSKTQDTKDSDKENQQLFDALKRSRDELSEELTAKKMERVAVENDVKTCEMTAERLAAELDDCALKIAGNNAEIAENDAQADAIRKAIEQAASNESKVDAGRVEEIRGKLGDLDKYKADLQQMVTELDTARQELMGELQNLRDERTKQEMLLLKVDEDIEKMQNNIFEQYQLSYETCLPFKDPEYNAQEGMPLIGKLRRQMSALGNINVDAIEQSQELSVSYEEESARRDDLVKAEEDMVKIIKDLSAEMLSRFEDQFRQIRTNFIKIFKELFNGGTADLNLQDSDDLLEAGIEIVAQPPEKKLQSITLLSGGEKALTAIAILFAILRLKPMPFCILDEIEAALDDANAGRFAKYLRRFSEETQFVVITHRKPTMELADNLYGVTMEEKGVSKIVSVQLSEAVSVAEPA